MATPPPLHTVFGRTAELRAISRFLEELRGSSQALSIDGQPGIGKTSVWRAGVRLAKERGFDVLSCRPAESERKLAFSGLADLLEPLPDEAFEELPEPQRHALQVALLRISPGERRPDPRALAAGLRGLLAGRASVRPVLLAVDDAQWLDVASAQAIEFALRRIAVEPVGLLASRRPGEALGPALGDVPPVLLGPLSLAAIHHAIKQKLDYVLPRPLLARVHSATGGNPFYALEIARILRETSLRPGEPLPIPRDLSRLALRRVQQLASSTRDVLLTAAAVAEPARDVLTALHPDEAESALEEAERAGVVEGHGSVVRFAHPLFAAAVYSSAAPPVRRRVHSRLAEVVGGLEEQARHLALATDAVDEGTASRLQDAAREVAARGAPAAAAELVQHALRLGARNTTAEAERVLALADYLHLAGDSHGAREVLETNAAWREAPAKLQAPAHTLLLELLYWTRDYVTAGDAGALALERAASTEVAAAIHAKLAEIWEVDMKRAAAHADSALALLEEAGADADPNVLARALAMRARNRLALGHGLDHALVERAIALEVEVGSRHTAHSYGQWLKYVDDLDGARRRLSETLRDAEEAGDEASVPNILQQLAITECWAGNLDLARGQAVRACELAEELGLVSVGVWRIRALVEAHVGNESEVRAIGAKLSSEGWEPGVLALLEAALGLLELSVGDAKAADVHLRAAVASTERMGQLELGVHRVHADAAEAALAVGDRAFAEQVVDRLETHGRKTAHVWSLATGARCRSLLEADRGDFAGALETSDEALSAHERLGMPYELARTLLARGQVERRMKRRKDAKSSFEHALALFGEIGARLWTDRAREELGRLGLRHAAPDELTPSELRIAELAASGLTNREVAQAAFVSPKTVEANLARVYRKLGIRSRAELGAWLGSRQA